MLGDKSVQKIAKGRGDLGPQRGARIWRRIQQKSLNLIEIIANPAFLLDPTSIIHIYNVINICISAKQRKQVKKEVAKASAGGATSFL